MSEAWTAFSAVSRSRVSPTRMMSGSWRRWARSTLAKVRSIFALTWVWPMPRSSYSIGSSMVRMFLSGALISERAEYSVVVLPDPVGPQTITMPWGRRIRRRK